MRISRTRTALAVTALLATVGAAAPAAASPARPAGCSPTWKLVDAPAAPGTKGYLSGVSALSARDVRFTGQAVQRAYTPWLTRWDGKSFTDPTSMATLPRTDLPGPTVSYASANDGWALAASREWSTAERWHDGRWTMTPTVVPTDPEHTSLALSGIAAVSADEAWAVGGTYKAGGGIVGNTIPLGALIEHWDGQEWQMVPSPLDDQEGAALRAVAARSATDIWAVGLRADGDAAAPLIEHYDGTSWTLASPAPSNGSSGFRAVGVGTDGSVFAVGSQMLPGTTSAAAPLVERWDGTAWRAEQLPDLGNGRVDSVYAASADNAWAIVEVPDGAHTFLHWDGSSWTAIEAPGPKELGLRYFFSGIDGVSGSDVWAAGVVTNETTLSSKTIVAHLSCGRK